MNDQQTIANRKKEGNKIALIFVLKMLVLYIIFHEANRFMYSVTSPAGKYYNAFVASYLNYIQWLRDALIIPSTWLIKCFGYITFHNASEIMIIDGPILSINYDCLGLRVMSFLVAFTLAFPSTWKAKGKLLILGILSVYVLNVIRISALGILLAKFPSQEANFEYHHEIFSITVYVVIFIILYKWVKTNTNVRPQTVV